MLQTKSVIRRTRFDSRIDFEFDAAQNHFCAAFFCRSGNEKSAAERQNSRMIEFGRNGLNMITVLKPGTTEEQMNQLIQWLKNQKLDVHISRGQDFTIL